jgi:hypothetical protein
MALLWCDGFGHYGVVGNMTNGVYAQVSAGVTLSTVNPRTGTYCIRQGGGTTASTTDLRRVLGGAKTTVGIGGAFYWGALPTDNNTQRLFQFADAANNLQLSVISQSTGVIEVFRGNGSGTSLGASATPAVVANAYQHIECVAFFSQTVGTVEVRVNGVTVLSISGVDTCATALTECSQVYIGGGCGSTGFSTTDLDDIFCYDNTGSYNNTFIGDRRVLTLFPDANTATADWTAVGAASGYLCIDEATPNDDTDYITAATVGLVSQFGLQNLPAGISVVNAVVMVERARKTEAGTANTQVSIVSGASNTAGADKPLTEIYTYRQDVFQTDPATAAPFAPAAVDALQFKVARTA